MSESQSAFERVRLRIRKATPDDLVRVRHFYHELIDLMEGEEYAPGWKRGVYPETEYLAQAIGAGELHMGEANGEIASCIVLNHEVNEGYAAARWPRRLDPEDFLVVHAFGVHPRQQGNGFAKQMLDYAAAVGRVEGVRCLRLDVVSGSVPAQRLYEHMGFQAVDTVPLHYADTGTVDFTLYELPLWG